jgi:hypothetical protein
MVNPTLGLENIVNTIHIDNISTNLDDNSHTNELQYPKVDSTATESENIDLMSNAKQCIQGVPSEHKRPKG